MTAGRTGSKVRRYEHEQVSDLTLCHIRCVIWGFRRELDENCAVLGHYAASSGNSWLTFRDNLSVLSSSWPLKMEWIGFPETSVRNYNYSLRNDPEERSSLLVSFSFDLTELKKTQLYIKTVSRRYMTCTILNVQQSLVEPVLASDSLACHLS
jgi:hypothetical protein